MLRDAEVCVVWTEVQGMVLSCITNTFSTHLLLHHVCILTHVGEREREKKTTLDPLTRVFLLFPTNVFQTHLRITIWVHLPSKRQQRWANRTQGRRTSPRMLHTNHTHAHPAPYLLRWLKSPHFSTFLHTVFSHIYRVTIKEIDTFNVVKGKGKVIAITGPVWPRGWAEV